MKIDDFLSRLSSVKQTGEGKWVARCPAHADHNPSLGVAVGSDGRILVKCYAGCSTDSVVGSLGLTMADLMADSGGKPSRRLSPQISAASLAPAPLKKSKPEKKDFGKLVATYDYQDENGNVIYRVERRVKADGKKTFCQMHPDKVSATGWAFGIPSTVTRVPFHLPRVINAVKNAKSIVICEGEKDVLTAEKLGLVATCNSGGAGHWQEGWGKYFQGAANILIIADNDAEISNGKIFAVGQKHATKVRRMLEAEGVGCKIKQMVMPSVNGEKCKDLTDWADAVEAAGGMANLESFVLAVKSAEAWPRRWDFDDDTESRFIWSKLLEDKTLGGQAPQKADIKKSEECPVTKLEEDRKNRFGEYLPRAPEQTKDKIAVDFLLDQTHKVKLTISAEDTIAYNFGISLALVLRSFQNYQMPKDVFTRLKAFVAAEWLLARGSFFWDKRNRAFGSCYYLDRDEKHCALMKIESDEFFAFVAAAAELESVDPKKGDLCKILGIVRQIAMSDEYAKGIIPSNQWDRRGDNIYISSGDAMMYKINKDGVKLVQNGTDDVVFLRGATLKKWKLLDGNGLDPFEHSRLFANAAWQDAAGKMNIRLWYFNLFACHRTKPVLLITGQAQSGKTRMATGLKEILYTRTHGDFDKATQSIEDNDKSLEAFWVSLNSGMLEVFDNVDSKIKWFSDALQNAATGGQIKRRTLYTSDGITILKSNAHIILTSNAPLFSTEGNGGMADRLITVNIGTFRTLSEEGSLSEQIRDNRDAYLTFTARVLAKVLADQKEDDGTINRRHPDYGKFSMKIGRALGCEEGVRAALGAAEAAKALLPLRTDIITSEILDVLKSQDRQWQMKFTSGQMADAIIAKMGDEADEKTKSIYNSRRVGNAITKYLRQFNLIFNMRQPRILEGKKLYEFDGLSALGKLALEVQTVGSVGFEGGFVYNSLGAGVCDKVVIIPSKPTESTNDIISSLEGKKEEEIKEDWSLDL